MKKFKIEAPMGSNVTPKEPMEEKTLREFALQIIHEPTQIEVWREKIEKDPIEDVIEWLAQSGYIVEVIH